MGKLKEECIMIVDDCEVSRLLLQKQLEERFNNVITASDGKGALEILEHTKVDIVLLDVIMPKMCGLETLVNIRKTRTNLDLPVIMVTSRSKEDDIVAALNSGASDYITKPVNINIAIARIQTQLDLVELNKLSLRMKEMEAVNAMIVTYNHEINNPLCVAIGNIDSGIKSGDKKDFEKSKSAMFKISEIVQKIKGVVSDGPPTYSNYTSHSKMVVLK